MHLIDINTLFKGSLNMIELVKCYVITKVFLT